MDTKTDDVKKGKESQQQTLCLVFGVGGEKSGWLLLDMCFSSISFSPVVFLLYLKN
jgi:hypothetical protein